MLQDQRCLSSYAEEYKHCWANQKKGYCYMNTPRSSGFSPIDRTTRVLCLASMLLITGSPVCGNVDTTKNLKTFGTMGKEVRPLSGGKEAELFSHTGRGCLTHMWFGGNFKNYGLTRIRVYVDGEKRASIDMELMMGHGIGFQDATAPWGIARIGKTGHPSGIYNTYRIPFGRSIRVTAELAKGEKGNPLFWWIIRGTENLPVEIAGVRLPDNARLKLHKLDNYTARRLEEFDICNTSRAGVLYQTTIAAKSTNFNYQESCVRAYINGKSAPLFLSSGLEDYFLGTYYFNKGKYYTPVAGLTHLDKKNSSFSAYRFHEDDPVFFAKGIRLTLRCGEEIDDKVFHNPQETTYTTYVWAYEWDLEPDKPDAGYGK